MSELVETWRGLALRCLLSRSSSSEQRRRAAVSRRFSLAVMVLLATTATFAAPVWDTQSDTWVGADALGRVLPGHAECGDPRKDKTVGIFYFLWMTGGAAVHDISRLLKENPSNPAYGPRHAFHWWGEPHLGYYRSDDPFVVRKHAQMLSDAGVDVVVFDVTNALTYDKQFLAVCRTFRELREKGRKTPEIAFLTHSSHERTTRHLYEALYSKRRFSELWCRWQGKPLIMGSDQNLSDPIRAFFTFRESWAWTDTSWFGDGRDKWPWLDHYPQTPGWHVDPKTSEQIAVCTAQHATSNIGRSFHDGRQPAGGALQTASGPCFAEQWKRALAVDPEFVFVTGWNEWIAQRFVKEEKGGAGRMLGKRLKPGDSWFVDQYNQEFSRDIEPMRGGHGDNYYYQMVANIRRFKGVRSAPGPSRPKSIAIGDDFSPWRYVMPEYRDDRGDTVHRAHRGHDAKTQYVETSGRNDIVLAKVARDDTYLHFYVQTVAEITDPCEGNWMTLLLNTDGRHDTGWNGYDVAINRHRKNRTRARVERCRGGWEWRELGEAPLAWRGNELHLRVSRELLGLDEKQQPLVVDFKWVDNVPIEPDIMDFINKGDVAPNGRFSYRFSE